MPQSKSKNNLRRENVTLAEDWIRENKKVEEFIVENGLGKLGTRGEMTCPFHDDLIPSLFVSYEKQVWKCHSCGRGGGYVKMYEHYYTVLENKKMNYYEAIEHILQSNVDMQMELKITSIFDSPKIELRKVLEIRGRQLPEKKTVHLNWNKLVRQLKHEGDLDKILRFVEGVERGFTPDGVLAFINQEVSDVMNYEGLGLEDILGM